AEPSPDAGARPPPRPRARDVRLRGSAGGVRFSRLRLRPRRDRPRRLRAAGSGQNGRPAAGREPPSARRARAGVDSRPRFGARPQEETRARPAGPGPVRGAGPAMTGFGRGRARLFAIALAAWAAVVLGRLFQLQLAEGSRYRARAQRQQERRIEVSARRGSIFDRAGRELAVSVEASSVYAISDEVSDVPRTTRVLLPLPHLPQPRPA